MSGFSEVKMIINKYFYDDSFELNDALLRYTKEKIANSKKEKLCIYLSGGATPSNFYQRLAEMDLANINFAMVDERWVDTENKASNEAFIRRCFDLNPDFNLTGLKNEALTAQRGWQKAENTYRHLPDNPTLIFLGMGKDGHIASLFPGALGIGDAMDLKNKHRLAVIEAIKSDVTGQWTERITITLAHILRSQSLVLLIQGEEKHELLNHILDTDVFHYPVSAILHQNQVAVDLFWCP